MSKLRFVTISSADIVVRTKKDNTIGSVTLTQNGKWVFVPYEGDEISRKHMVEIAEYMLRLVNVPKAKTDDSGPVVTGTLKVEKPHTMTPGFVAHEPQTIRYPNFDPVRQATVAFPEPDPVQKVVMTPGFVAQEPKVAAFTTEPDGKVTIAYDVRQPGTVTQYATAASSRMVMPGTASIRFVIEGRDYTLDINGVIVGENASVELRQENDTWSL